MKKELTKHYEAPSAELIEVQVEKGFAVSPERLNPYNPWGQ